MSSELRDPSPVLHPTDFTGLPERERHVAAYVDRLPAGAAMDIKSLAEDLPLGRREPRPALSAADCAALEPLAAARLARGLGADHLASTLPAGLPEDVAFPRGPVRRQLGDRMPPRLPEPPQQGHPASGLRGECVECGRPGPADALPDGLCRPCRGPGHRPSAPDGRDGVADRVAGLRGLMRTP
ncbi:hypothetical protein [Streptomyces sp. SHP 1-2]|uniref:hypothetical protein n=1 Tax=Streptomyces sp. SHP 1-2 TaxID=2769489 RepID=UPI002238F134|nr:hypothetical protein [Streptomyces sp. SHP 1-2]